MSAVKTYFKEETKLVMLGLEHPKPSDFYLTVNLQYWLIFLTHWGLLAIVCTTGFATAVSARVYFYGPLNSDCCLPWYVKTYWVLYNIANPLAFLITIFYWTILYEAGVQEEMNFGLDVAVHGLNTLIMLLLLFSSGHSGRLLHIHHPVMFGLGWVIFSVIYYLAGGVNTFGQPFIYPVIDWSKPGFATLMILLTAVLLVVLHLATIGMAALRDAAAARCCRAGVTHHIEEGTPLRQQTVYQPTTVQLN
ncbi:hypothetical protein NE865_02943 [Phthorimaea operculella]|nr:hypothetical protein NE865_02943 [Phthorimaea operculella]